MYISKWLVIFPGKLPPLQKSWIRPLAFMGLAASMVWMYQNRNPARTGVSAELSYGGGGSKQPKIPPGTGFGKGCQISYIFFGGGGGSGNLEPPLATPLPQDEFCPRLSDRRYGPRARRTSDMSRHLVFNLLRSQASHNRCYYLVLQNYTLTKSFTCMQSAINLGGFRAGLNNRF